MNSKHLMIIAALLLLATWYLPLWTISLEAPQYPEGLGLEIRLNTISGLKTPQDLDKINNLNHYIGMKTIRPASIPELVWMPYIFGTMIILGFFAAFSNRRSLIIGWVVIFLLLGVLGLYDFYLWGYDYGHNLDVENAIIKIPGMSYQPPVIGSKQLLNFTAHSLPASGTGVVFVSILLASIAAWLLPATTKAGKGGVS